MRSARRAGGCRSDSRDDRLLPDREKVRRADFHYRNTGTPEELDAWVAGVMAELDGHPELDEPQVDRHRDRGAVAVVAGGAIAVWQSRPDFVQRVQYPLKYEHIVTGHAENYRLDPSLLAAVIYAESRFDADARSEAGAVGLMQLLPETAEAIALRTGGHRFVVSDLLDPELNVRYGSWYLRNLLNRYDDERTALAAYHAGQGNVDRWRASGEGIGFPETRAYVDRVQDAKAVYRELWADELGL